MTRTKSGSLSCEVMIHGTRIYLGRYKYRSEAMFVDKIADKIRVALTDHQKALERTQLIERYRFKEAMSEIKDSGVVR